MTLVAAGPSTDRAAEEAARTPQEDDAAFPDVCGDGGGVLLGKGVPATTTWSVGADAEADFDGRNDSGGVEGRVKDHLLAHPGVHDAAVVAMPDARLGERTCAFVIAREDPPTAAELRRFLRVRGRAGFKILDRVEAVDRFPYTGVCKTCAGPSPSRWQTDDCDDGSAHDRPPPDAVGGRPARQPRVLRRAVLLVHDMRHYLLRAFTSDASPAVALIDHIGRLTAACRRPGVPGMRCGTLAMDESRLGHEPVED